MARLTEEQWENLIAEYHTGVFSKNELAEKYEVSHTAVNKRLKGVEPKHRDKVSTLISIKSELAHESFKEVSAVETIVSERTKHLIMFQNSAIRNQRLNDKRLEALEKICLTSDNWLLDKDATKIIDHHAKTTQINKETVLGKEADTIINNTNAQQNNQPTQINIIRDI